MACYLSLLHMTVLFLVLTITLSSNTTATMATPRTKADMGSMMERLKLDPGSTNCWASLVELQACTGEVIEFFYDGETYLGPGCCQAIRVIEHHCWPAMLTGLGFTSEEGDILRLYCDSEDQDQQNGN